MPPAAAKSASWLREWWHIIALVLAIVYATGQLTARVATLEATVERAVTGGERLANNMRDLETEMIRIRTLLEKRSQGGATLP